MEMHTSHVYKGDQLLILGGRALPQGQSLDKIEFSDMIYQVDLKTGKVSEFGKLPSGIGSHVSCIVDDEYLCVYGGTNGYRFFDSILRYEIATKKWTLLTKMPGVWEHSKWFKDGRVGASYCQLDNQYALFFGGCSAEVDYSDFLVVNFDLIRDDEAFNEITEIM